MRAETIEWGTPVHPDRQRPGGRLWEPSEGIVVIHTSEGGEQAASAEALAAFMTRPGDRPQPDGTMYGAAYHEVIDHDRVIIMGPPTMQPYHAAGANQFGYGIVIPGTAGQTPWAWNDTASAVQLDVLSRRLADLHDLWGIRLERIYDYQLAAGRRGAVCGHVDVSHAFGRSTHWDPGPAFPFQQTLDRAAALVQRTPQPEPEDDMRYYLWRHPAYAVWWIVAGGDITPATPFDYSEARGSGGVIPLVEEAHDLRLRAACNQNGLTLADLPTA